MQCEFFILEAGKQILPKELSRRILRTNSAELDSYALDDPRPVKVQSETAGSGAVTYKYHRWNATYVCHV